jgi:hypothetical protein
MYIQMRRSCLLDGEHRPAGAVVEVTESTGRYAVAAGWAVPAGDPAEIEVAVPVVAHRDPRPARRR